MNNKNKSKRYYWIKIKESFLTSETVDYLISQDGGNGFAYVTLYQCLCLKCVNTEGKLARQINDILIPYDFAKLKRDLKWFSLEQIQRAFQLFAQLGLIYKQEDNIIAISNFDEMVGSETGQASEKRRIRAEKKKELGNIQCPENVYQDIRYKRLDIRDKRLDIRDNKIELDITRYKQKELLQILIESKYLDENLIQDTSYDELLDSLVTQYGYVDTKIKVKYFADTYKFNKPKVDDKYNYLKLSLSNSFERPINY